MKTQPPERFRRKPSGIRRIERNVAITMAGAIAALVYFGFGGGHDSNFGALTMSAPIGADVSAVVAIFAFIALNAIFVAGETSIEILRPMHVRHLRDKDDKHTTRIQQILDGKPEYVATCIVGGHLSRIAMVLAGFELAQGLALRLSAWGGWACDFGLILIAATLVAIPVMLLNLVVGDLVPKSYASLHPVSTARALFRFLRLFYVIFLIPAKLVSGAAGILTARFGGRASFTIANQAEQEIRTLVETAEETGEIETDEKELLHSVFEFSDTVVREVMTPRVDLDAMPIQSEASAVVSMIRETGHSRIPLYEENDDQIVGIIHAKDLLMAMIETPTPPEVRALMRPALFVPENKNLHDLLAEMRQSRSQMAVVQDEFGGTAGIVTIEDIVEELVGDIVDEYDVEEPEIVQTADGYLVDGKTHVDDVGRELGVEIDSEEFDTIGGYLFGLFGRQPRQDESIESDGHRFTVAETDGRRIVRLKIEKLATQVDVGMSETSG